MRNVVNDGFEDRSWFEVFKVGDYYRLVVECDKSCFGFVGVDVKVFGKGFDEVFFCVIYGSSFVGWIYYKNNVGWVFGFGILWKYVYMFMLLKV